MAIMYWNVPSALFAAEGINNRGKYRISGLPTFCQKTVDFYLKSETVLFQRPLDEWDGDGLWLDAINQIGTVGPNADAQVTTDYVGDDVTLQDKPTGGDGIGIGGYTGRGWHLAGPEINSVPGVAVVRWDVPGGFSKIT